MRTIKHQTRNVQRLGARFVGMAVLGLLAMPGATVSAEAEGGPVLVELFTSQGCSSCPAADRLLAQLGEMSGGEVVPLAFHIDAWNHLGWTDPFSSAEWTRRQADYASELGAQRYTPQAVVAGRTEVLGSDEQSIRAAVATAAAEPHGALALTLTPTASKIDVTVDVELPDSLRDRKLDLMVAVFESGLVTPVEQGENGGRTLHNEYVVRRLERAGRVRPRDPEQTRHSASLKIADDWQRSELGVAAFLQDARSLAIHGAAVQNLQEGDGEG